MGTASPTIIYGFSNIEIAKQIAFAETVFAGLSRAGQTISVYHGDTLIADCVMPSTGSEQLPTVLVGTPTVHDETFSGFVDGETYTIVAGDEPPITGFVVNGGLASFDVGSFLGVINFPGEGWIGVDSTENHHTFSVSKKVQTTRKKYDIKLLPEELLPKNVAKKADVLKAQRLANNAQATANDAQSTAENAQATANDAQATANDAQATANDAQSTAENAQATANDAQSTAENAQSAAKSIKPDWEEINADSPKYIANRPFYEDLIVDDRSLTPVITDTLIEGTQLYSGTGRRTTDEADLDGNVKSYVEVNTSEVFSPSFVYTNVGNSYNIAGVAIGNLHLLNVEFPNLYLSGGESLPDTGEEWAYYKKSVTFVCAISKTQGRQITLKRLIDKKLKQLDEKFIPDSIQRVGGGVQPDWSQNDETAADFVKNRPGGYSKFEDGTPVTHTLNYTEAVNGGFVATDQGTSLKIKAGSPVISRVTYDGVDYIVDRNSTQPQSVCIGDAALEKYPFALGCEKYVGGGSYTYYDAVKTAGEHTITVTPMIEVPVKIPEKYMSPIAQEVYPISKTVSITRFYSSSYDDAEGKSHPWLNIDSYDSPPRICVDSKHGWYFHALPLCVTDATPTFETDLAAGEFFTGIVFRIENAKYELDYYGVVLTGISTSDAASSQPALVVRRITELQRS